MKLSKVIGKMIEYQICEINKNQFLKVLKCTSKPASTNTNQQMPIEDRFKRNPVIVIIPGNPGVIEFYEKFAIELNETTGYDVIGLSHTGHLFDDRIHRHYWKPSDVYGQINDKVKFIENYFMCTDNDRKNNGEPPEIFFIGHSFGCYCTLEILSLLNKEVKSQVKQAFLMFPMIERMSETPSGKNLNVVTKFLMWLVLLTTYLITFLPRFVSAFLVKMLWANRIPDLHNDLDKVVVDMSQTFSCSHGCFHLGRNELQIVKNLNTNAISQNYELLTFYYGTIDRWAPVDFYHDMKYYVDELHTQAGKKASHRRVKLDECQPPLEHGFVIFKKQTMIISKMIAEWIDDLK